MRGIFITFEGGDGCGKSTQIDRLARRLEASGLPLRTTREPGGTALGEAIRHLLQTAKEGEGMSPETELLLFAASRAQLVREVIEPALASGVSILADRFFDSTTVYQGIARKLDPAAVRLINEFALGALRPDLTLVFDLEPAEARRRMSARSGQGPDRMESLPPVFHEAVRDGYLKLAQTEPDRIKVIDAACSVDELHETIWTLLQEKFHGLFAARRI